MDLCLSGISSVQIYSLLLTQAKWSSSNPAEDENFYFYHTFFRTEISGVFWTEVTSFLLGSGKEYSEEKVEAKTYISSGGSQLRYEGMRHLCWDLECDYFL